MVATGDRERTTRDARWCDCEPGEESSGNPDSVPAHDITCMYNGDPEREDFKARCRCWEPPVIARGALTMLQHDDGCGFPERRCDNDEHRLFIHAACGRPVRMRFCGCAGSDHGYTFDQVRDWWVHYVCGWPTRLWFEGSAKPAPPALEGVKPVTYHEYQAVPKTPKRAWMSLSPEQQAANSAAIGRWVWD